jgi:hypothetical protein
MAELDVMVSRRERDRTRRRSWLAGTGRVFSVVASVFLCLGISVAAAGVVEALPIAHNSASAPGAAAASVSNCPRSNVCVSLPCKHRGHCPTVEAAPTSDLGGDQWVYLNMSNFPAGDLLEVSYCTATKPITTKSEPLCDAISTPTLPNPQQQLPVFPNGSALASFQVELNPPAPGNIPYTGVIPGTIPPVTGKFFCDNRPQKCAIIVTDSALGAGASGVPTASNTLVIPISFRNASIGCPTAQFVFSSSDFSVEQLFPHESSFACANSHPVIPVDTASDSGTAVQSLVTGGTSIAFITNPLSSSVQQQLSKEHGKFAIIPVALSAVVLGYQATMQQGFGSFYAFDSMRLTPSQVAGVITYNYSSPFLSDIVHCPAQVTTQLYQAPSPPGPCPLMYAMNTVKGFGTADSYGVFLPSYQSGVTRELINWICNAPNAPVIVDGARVHDPNLARHELTTSTFDNRWPIKDCAPFDGFPAIPSPNSAQYALVNSPAIQVKFLRQFLPPPQTESHPAAAFAPVDWSEARYLGLNAIALQNAAGYFVAPTVASVEAALTLTRPGPYGVLEPSFTTRNKDNYPLPEITYAVVPTAKLTTTSATQMQSLLDELLNFTGGTDSSHLPAGFAPLPAWLYKRALGEVTTEIVAPPVKPQHGGSGGGGGGGTTTTTTSTTTTTTIPPTTTTAPAPTTTTSSTVPPTTTTSTVPPTTSTVARARHIGPPPAVHYSAVLLQGSGSRLAFPLIVAGGCLSIIPGTLLLARRRARSAGERAVPEGSESDD